MKGLTTAIALFTALLLGACAGMERKSGELPFPAKRLTQKGFSFMPPNEPNWIIAGRNESQLLLAKQRTLTDESVSIVAIYVDLPPAKSAAELVRHVRASDLEVTQAQRYRVREHEVAEHGAGGVACARSYMLVEDHDGERTARTIGALLLESVTLICPHPADGTLGVSLSWSHRFHPEDRDRQLVQKGMAMFDTIEFSDL
jgi:hypothetical protein